MAGYSGTPLAKKLGLRPGSRFLVVAAPSEFAAALGDVPDGLERTEAVRASSALGKVRHDVALVFVLRRADLSKAFARVTARMTPAGGVWIAWPKKASKVPTDVTEDVLRELLLPTGWVDNKVCAIDERWSGLRFVLRRERRPTGTSALTPGSTSRILGPLSRRPASRTGPARASPPARRASRRPQTPRSTR